MTVEPVRTLSTPRDLLETYLAMSARLNLHGVESIDDAVAAIAASAVAIVPGVEAASVSDRRPDGRFRTLASTATLASIGDRIQYELGSGPCVDAMVDNATYVTGDVATDLRWPRFGARAHAETGVASMLAFRLFLELDTDRVAALTLYSTRSDAYDDTAEVLGTILATHCSAALSAFTAREKALNLEKALLSNRRIGMAVGVLMITHKITDDDAFGLLRVASQSANRKLLDIANEVVETGTLELPPVRTSAKAAPRR